MTEKKALVLGIGQSNFLDQLYGGIRSVDKQFTFTLADYSDLSGQNSEFNSRIFDGNLKLRQLQLRKHELLAAFLSFAFTGFFWQIAHFEWSQRAGLKKMIKELKRYSRARYIVTKVLLVKKFDLYHFHFCTPENLTYLQFLPETEKSICSFWGSDLMRITGTSNVFYVSRALNRCSQITIQTTDLAQMLFCKYGQNLREKLETLRFTQHMGIYESIAQLKNIGYKQTFCDKHDIPGDHQIVAIAHNSNEANNHLQICRELHKLSPELKQNTTFLLHLAYGGQPQYLKRLREFIKQDSSLNYRIIDGFLDEKDIALLRLSTRIYIHLPISDALSGAMTEFLYAGADVISGNWLPYKLLRSRGIDFHEIEKMDELPQLIATILSGKPNESAGQNAQKIASFLFPDTTNLAWVALLNKVTDGV